MQNRKAELKGQTSSVRGGESMTYANKILLYLFKSGFISVVNGFKIREFMNENSNDSGFFDQNKSSNLKGEETEIVLDKNSPEKEWKSENDSGNEVEKSKSKPKGAVLNIHSSQPSGSSGSSY